MEDHPHPFYVGDGFDADGADLQWTYCNLEPKKKKLKEQDFLNGNTLVSSGNCLQTRPVSTGLGLSLDNSRMDSSAVAIAGGGSSLLLSLMGDAIDVELRKHDAELDRFLKVEGDRMRQAVLEKFQASQLQTLSIVEGKNLQKLCEREVEVENMNLKNMELEEQVEQLSIEAAAWQQRAQYNENMIAALRFNLQQVYAQSRDSKEGCGDSEVDDTASCCIPRAADFHLSKEKNDTKALLTCKFCGVNEVCMLLFPCKHLCLCKDCESKLSCCPLCQSSKFMSMEIFM